MKMHSTETLPRELKTRTNRIPRSAGAIFFSALLLTLLTHSGRIAAAQAAERTANEPLVALAGHTPAKVMDGTAVRVDHYNPENKLRLALAVQPPHMAEEEEFIKELTTKGSPNFQKYLTPEEWNARFAPSPEDEQKVVDWVQSQGLTVTHRYANRLLVDVEGPVGTIEKAFGVTINHYQVDDEVDFANDRDPVVSSSLNGILYSVLGLNSIDRVHSGLHKGKDKKGPDYVPGPAFVEGESVQRDGDPSKSPSAVRAALESGQKSPRPSFTNGYADPGDIFSSQAYNWDGLQEFSHCCNVHNDSGGSPKETSIALATYAGFTPSDILAFADDYGFALNVKPLAINGASGTPGTECDPLDSGCTGPGVDDEATLDTEYSSATSNSYGSYLDTARVWVYEGVNQDYDTITDMFNYMVNDEHARVMSTSWSGAEVTSGNNYTYWEVPNHSIFNNMAGLGWTLIGDADDQGSTGNCSTLSVNFPASDNNFVAAGGTALQLYSNGDWDYEVAWTGGTGSTACQNNDGGGGGGVSVLWSQPYWQSDYSSVSKWGSMRLEPDMALNAGGIGQNYYYQGALHPVGGTSIVAPELAGFFAQENTYLNYMGSICGSGTAACTPVGNPNVWMYYVGGSGARHDPYYDITSGCTSNNVTIANGLTAWCAVDGFDLATGWGSANMMQLAWGINFERLPGYSTPAITWDDQPTTDFWYNTDQEVSWTVTDAGSSGLPAAGVAGFTQGWDSIPADPYSEPHGGSGNSFYSGPEYVSGSLTSQGGCLSFNGGFGCTGGSGQGCHTVKVRAWDNTGTTAEKNYGPLCFDNVPPTVAISNNPVLPASGWYKGSAAVTLTATDPGGSNASGIYKTYYSINTTACVSTSLGSCNVYGGPVTISAQGYNYIWYFAEDNAGNFSSPSYEYVDIDTTPPVTAETLAGTISGGKYYSDVKVTLAATDNLSGVAHTYYTLDGGSQVTYSGAFTVSAVGSHTVKYWTVDVAGNIEATHTSTFTIAGFPSTMTSPTPGTALAGSSATFTWTAGTGVTDYELRLGTTGAGSSNLYTSGVITATTATATGLPTTGATVTATLYSEIGGVWESNTYTYTEAAATPVPAVLTTPTPGTVLAGSSVTFTWTTGTGVTDYELRLGTTGAGSSNLYTSGVTTATTAAVTGLPTTGATVYATLYSEISGVWHTNSYTYTEASSVPAVLTTPTPGSTFAGSSVTFTWTAGSGVTEYELRLGTTGAGSSNLYNSGTTTATTEAVTGLPTTGATVTATLYSLIGGTWHDNVYTYTEQ